MKSGRSCLILLLFVSFCGGSTEETLPPIETTTTSSTATVPKPIVLEVVNCSYDNPGDKTLGISNGYRFSVQIVGYAMNGIVDNKDFFAQFQKYSVSGTYDDKSFYGEFDGITLTLTGPPQAIVIGCILGFK